jgi:Holliday junction resolvasome RuvABC DNA-binding subunit
MARWSGASETLGSAASGGGDRMEAIAALEVLGFSRPAVEKAVASAIASQPEAGVEGWIKLALAAL